MIFCPSLASYISKPCLEMRNLGYIKQQYFPIYLLTNVENQSKALTISSVAGDEFGVSNHSEVGTKMDIFHGF